MQGIQLQQTTLQNAASTIGNGVAMPVGGLASVTMNVTGTWTGTLTVQVTQDDTNWVTALVYPIGGGAATTTISSGSTGLWRVCVAALSQVRIVLSNSPTGAVTVTCLGSYAPFIGN